MNYFTDLAQTLQRIDAEKLRPILEAVRLAREDRRTVFVCGNGGSYANAIHWVTDLTKVTGVRALALGTNNSLLTAVSNDNSYQDALARELAWLARPKDVLIVLSVSGKSPNVLSAVQVAIDRGFDWFMLTQRIGQETANVIHLPATDYGLVEDMHSAIGHWLTKELSS